GFQNESVDRAGGQKEKEHRRREKRHGPKGRDGEKRAKRERHGDEHGKSQRPGVAGTIAFLPGRRGESAKQRAHESGDHEHRAEKFRRLFHAHAVSAMQKRWPPMPKRTQRER